MNSNYFYPLSSRACYYFGTIKNLSPLRVGSGKGTAEEIDMPIIYSNGKPFIPGTSLKGALRTEAERFVKLEGKYDVFFPDELTDLIKEKKDLEKIARCPTCILFGAPHLFARLSVYDSYVTGEYRIGYRTTTSINRVTGAQKYGALFNMEYVEPGASFSFRMVVRGVKFGGDDSDIEAYMGKIVKHLLETMQSGDFQLGSKKSSGFGRVILMLSEKKGDSCEP